MYRRKLLISALALSLILMSLLPVTRADWVFNRRTFEGSFNVYPLNFQAAISNLEEGYKEQISFNCTSGGDQTLNFFICNETNFNLWVAGHSVEVFCRHDMVISWSGEFEAPFEDTWYHVFSNMHSPTTTKRVNLIIDLYEWQDPFSPTINPIQRGMLAGALIAVLGIIFVIAIVVWYRKKPQGDYWETRSHQPPSPYPPCVCPRCQTPIEADEAYCHQCGCRL